MHIRGMSFLIIFFFHQYLRKIANMKIYMNICENNFSLSHETKMRDTRSALDYVQTQRMCLNLNVDTYPVFSFFRKFRILNGLIMTSLLTVQKAQIQRKENTALAPVLILMLGRFLPYSISLEFYLFYLQMVVGWQTCFFLYFSIFFN